MTFREYLQHGWKLCAIPSGHKGPQGAASMGWQKRERAITDPNIGPQLAGAGLLHAWSGTCALDVDNYLLAADWLKQRGVDLEALLTARDSVQVSSGREGRYKLLYSLPEPLASKKLAPYKAVSQTTGKEQTYHAFELRCANAAGETLQDVLPPSIHPTTGRPYEWKFGDDLCGDWRRLPTIPPALLAVWQAQLTESTDVGITAPSGATAAELDKLIAQYDPECDYDTWIKVGAALHHETKGSAAGFNAWDRWSSRAGKYKGRGDLAPHWQSFRADAANAVTLGSLRRESVADVVDFPVAEPSSDKPPLKDWDLVQDVVESRLVFVPGQDSYFDLASKSDGWLSDRAVRHLFCPAMPKIEDGKKAIIPDPVVFLQNSRTKRVVDAVGIHPGGERFYTEDDRKYVNRYVRKEVKPLIPVPWEEEAFIFLWKRMKDDLFQRWLMQFYAHALQKPGVKIQSAPLLYSAETGTGKNTICKVIPELLFGNRWVRTMSGNVLGSNFNDVVGETWWLYLEELRSGATKVDRVAMTNKLKAWITDNTIEVHPKGLRPFDIRNRIQITATSNFDDAVQIDNNDRRWAVCEMEESIKEDDARTIYKFLNSDRAPGVLRYIFGNTDISGFNPTARAPMTLAKVQMIRAGIGAWESMLLEMFINERAPFDRDIFRLQDAFDQLAGKHGPSSVHALRQVLVKPPFSCTQLPNSAKVRVYAWRNKDRWVTQSEAVRVRYMESGNRPVHLNWSTDIPESILNMSADGPPQKTCDLI